MNIALIGYGKMGRAVERIALQKGHEIILKITSSNQNELNVSNLKNADVAIEFSTPGTAVNNILTCLNAGLPIITGTTGWTDKWNEVKDAVEEKKGTFLFASNFSIGVNLFFELNKHLANLMATHPEYDITIKEIHHAEKKDAPSGTAITIADQIIATNPSKKQWVNRYSDEPDELVIISERENAVPGTHAISYRSPVDDIEIVHKAHNRQGFAKGAVLAAEFVVGKKGIFTMKDVLGIE